MRGQSFHGEVSCDTCKKIHNLIESKRKEFEDGEYD